jgi:hypothetical protein
LHQPKSWCNNFKTAFNIYQIQDMAHTANLTVYLQALGGHFLGANAYDPDNIELSFRNSFGEINIPYTVTTNFTDDGNVSPNFTNGASSFMPIITIPQALPSPQIATINYLSPDFTTISGKVTFNLPDEIEFADLMVSIPTTLGKSMLIKQQVLLNPDQPDYKINVVVPGLYLSVAEISGSLALYVKMMCGCPITPGPPASLWPANDFTVFANVMDISGAITPYLLAYNDNSTSVKSLFSVKLSANQKPIKSIRFTAFQKSTGNYGALNQSV